MPERKSRRSFLREGTAAGTASFLAGGIGHAAENEKKGDDRKLKIGTIGFGPYSFMDWSWGDVIEGTKPGSPRGNFGTRLLNMEITHAWDTNKENARKFADRIGGVEVVDKFDGMIGKIDGLIMSDFGDVGYQHKLVIPYLEAGIPTYLGRPFSYSLRDIDAVLEAAAKGGAPLMATAKYEHYKEVPALQGKLKNVGTVRLVQAAAFTIDFPVHFHIQFMMLKMLGYDVKRVSMFTDHDMKSMYVHQTFLYPGKDDQPPYLCTIDGTRIPDSFHIRVFGDTGIEEASMLRGYDWQYSLLHRYAPQIVDMQRTFEGNNYEPFDIVRKKTEIFLNCYYSYLERGGAPVDVGTVPADWRVTSPNIDQRQDIDKYS